MTYVSIPGGSLARAAVDGSQRLQLTSSPLAASMPHWSADGKQIAFSGGTPGKPNRIYVVSSDGGTVRQVSNGESGKYGDDDPSWSPDGASLAVVLAIIGICLLLENDPNSDLLDRPVL